MLATNPVGQISQIRRNRQKDLPRWWYLSYRYIIIVVPNPRMQNCRFSIEYHGSGIFVCYYRGYYCGNNYNASSVWPQFVLMLCLPGKNSGASERGQSIRWSPGHRDSIDTWGASGEGEGEICLVPPTSVSTGGENRNLRQHQLFNWNIFQDSFLNYFEKFLNIYLNSGPKYFVYDPL